jgi:hypothetical protein
MDGAPHFNGPEYEPEHDHHRLTNQLDRIKSCMADGRWHSLGEISRLTGDPEASVSAQLRHLRKERFGSFIIERQPRGNRHEGLFEYRLRPPAEGDEDVKPAGKKRGPKPKRKLVRRSYLQSVERLLRAARSVCARMPLFTPELLRAIDAVEEEQRKG